MAHGNSPQQNFSIEQAIKFSESPAGKQLISLLQKQGNVNLNKAQQQAASGQMDEARKSLSSLLSDPQIQRLLKEFGG